MRGVTKTHRSDGAYRAEKREGSTLVQDRERRVIRELSQGTVRWGQGETKLERTRQEVLEGWRGVSARLKADGDTELAQSVDSFLAHMPSAKTERRSVIDRYRARTRTR